MESLRGRTAIVTGGTRGIGRAVAERLLREGAVVAICGRQAETTERAAEEMEALGAVFGLACDVTSFEQVRAFFAACDRRLPTLDILVNNAGEGVFRKVREMTAEEWRRNIDLNLNGPFYCAHEALALFAGRGGFIVNISSLAAKNAFSGGAGYNASKAGLNIFTEALMLDHRLRQCARLLHHAGQRRYGIRLATRPSGRRHRLDDCARRRGGGRDDGASHAVPAP